MKIQQKEQRTKVSNAEGGCSMAEKAKISTCHCLHTTPFSRGASLGNCNCAKGTLHRTIIFPRMQIVGHMAQWLERLTADHQVPGSKSGRALIVTRKFRTQSTIFYARKSSKPRHPPSPKAFSPATCLNYVSTVEAAWQSKVIRNNISHRDMCLGSSSRAETSTRPALTAGCSWKASKQELRKHCRSALASLARLVEHPLSTQ